VSFSAFHPKALKKENSWQVSWLARLPGRLPIPDWYSGNVAVAASKSRLQLRGQLLFFTRFPINPVQAKPVYRTSCGKGSNFYEFPVREGDKILILVTGDW
jgi:hypothetical protein